MCMEDIPHDLYHAAETALRDCMALKQDEVLLVITDAEKELIGQALWYAGRELSREPVLMMMNPRKENGENLPPLIEEAMKKSDVVIIPTAKSATHTDARINACAAGARVGTMPGITQDTMERCFSVDYKKIAERTIKLNDIMTDANDVHITTPAGTDIKFSIKGIKGIASTGIVSEPGKFGNLPSGESYLMPVEGDAEGVFIVDGSMAGLGLIEDDEKLTIKVEKGFATDITGGEAAKKLIKLLEPHGKPARNIAEFGVGTNDGARVIGEILEDEKVMGTVHLALGNNKSMGGTVGVQLHLDGIMMNPSFTLDGKEIMKDGKFLIDLD